MLASHCSLLCARAFLHNATVRCMRVVQSCDSAAIKSMHCGSGQLGAYYDSAVVRDLQYAGFEKWCLLSLSNRLHSSVNPSVSNGHCTDSTSLLPTETHESHSCSVEALQPSPKSTRACEIPELNMHSHSLHTLVKQPCCFTRRHKQTIGEALQASVFTPRLCVALAE
jgi:hypothetical protein